MTARRGFSSLLEKSLCLTFLIVLAAGQECDKTKCPGPLRYYKDLGCKPLYEHPDDCCPIEYNCDHLKSRSKDKCYVNGHEYNVGDMLKEEDQNPCDLGCTCQEGQDGVAKFMCAVVDCFFGPMEPNCYRRRKATDCCSSSQVCLKEGEERPTCEVDGKIYKDGEYFKPESDPELNCYCGPDYKGENVEPFCAKPKRPYCSPDFRNPEDVYNHCAPVYYPDQTPQTDCSVFSRCQNSNDTVIHTHEEPKSSTSVETLESLTCQFGDMKMHLGDELNQATDYSSVCVKCVCEVPPAPTCQRLPNSECDVTKHEPFSRR